VHTVTVESVGRPMGAVMVWIATHHEIIPALAHAPQMGRPPGLPVPPTGHTAGRLLLRALLACHLDEDCTEVQIVLDARGKPSLLRQDGTKCAVEITISHSHTHVAVAMSHCGPIGIDTESRRVSETQMRSMPARILGLPAAERFAALNPATQNEELLRQWCAREALLKAWGDGLTRDPRSVQLPVPLPVSPMTVEGLTVQAITTAPVVCLAHPVLVGRRVEFGVRRYGGNSDP
jgi:4'-phosphopantetheinyl transferase